jgi:uncharacterized glyoxalase superfamily protein PhnB
MNIQPDMIGIVVNDMRKAIVFYRLLGLPFPDSNEAYVEVITENGYRISLNTAEMMKGIYGEWETPRGHRMNIAFKCASPAEVDRVYATIVAAGYASIKTPWDAFWGQRYAVVQDPDGNWVDLFAAL